MGDKDCMDCDGSGVFYQMEAVFCGCVPFAVGDIVSFKWYLDISADLEKSSLEEYQTGYVEKINEDSNSVTVRVGNIVYFVLESDAALKFKIV